MTSPARGGHDRDPRPAPAPPPPPRWRGLLILVGVLITVGLFFTPSVHRHKTSQLNYSQLVAAVKKNDVSTITIKPSGAVDGKLKSGTGYTSQIPTALPDSALYPTLSRHHVAITATSSGTGGTDLFVYLLPLIFFVAIFWWLGRKRQGASAGGGLGGIGGLGGMRGIGASKAKLYDEQRPTTRFDDVAGYEGAKQEISEVVDFLRHPSRYAAAGAVGPRGVLMVGPPGTGKTLLARAVAGEAGVPFFALTGSSFVEMFVGVGASRVRDLFANARRRAPAIVFIDEIDAIGQRRGGSMIGNDEREQTLNQMLAEMDGFDPSTGVVVMAATNRPEVLDPALLRPGRFDRRVVIALPHLAERAAILRVHAAGKHLAPDVDLAAVARATPGFGGADLANLLNEAAIVAVRHDRSEIHQGDLDEARDRITIGRSEAANALLPEERRSVAVHESGHALVAALLDNTDPVSKVTILPAGQALGNTQIVPSYERHLYPESYLLDSLAVRLGGRAAELVVLGDASTGAANDLSGATELALHMVRDYGMSNKVGPVGFASNAPQYLGNEAITSRSYAEGTQWLIDQEVTRLLRDAEDRATAILSEHRRELDRLVELLIEHEQVDGTAVYEIVGRPVPCGPAVEVAPEAAAAADADGVVGANGNGRVGGLGPSVAAAERAAAEGAAAVLGALPEEGAGGP